MEILEDLGSYKEVASLWGRGGTTPTLVAPPRLCREGQNSDRHSVQCTIAATNPSALLLNPPSLHSVPRALLLENI